MGTRETPDDLLRSVHLVMGLIGDAVAQIDAILHTLHGTFGGEGWGEVSNHAIPPRFGPLAELLEVSAKQAQASRELADCARERIKRSHACLQKGRACLARNELLLRKWQSLAL